MITPRRHLYSLAAAIGLAIAGVALAQQVDAPEKQLAVQDVTIGVVADGTGKLRVGASIDPDRLHRVTRPGLYGISQSPSGSNYGILEGRLIRFDPEGLRIQSVIREVGEILD